LRIIDNDKNRMKITEGILKHVYNLKDDQNHAAKPSGCSV
jgi:hypothetical protein